MSRTCKYPVNLVLVHNGFVVFLFTAVEKSNKYPQKWQFWASLATEMLYEVFKIETHWNWRINADTVRHLCTTWRYLVPFQSQMQPHWTVSTMHSNFRITLRCLFCSKGWFMDFPTQRLISYPIIFAYESAHLNRNCHVECVKES